MAYDSDYALHPDQFKKLRSFLADKLDPDDMQTVENICMAKGDAPDEPAAGANDAARSRPRAAVPGVKYDAVTFPDSGRLK